MKKLTYSVTIEKDQEFVFRKFIDKSVYPEWAKAWGDGMDYIGEWKAGAHISYFDQSQGGTKVVIEEIVPNQSIRTKHIAMVNAQNIEVDLTDDMMRKWIGTEEDYFFKKVKDNQTVLEVVLHTDPTFEKMMDAWDKALHYFKEICES